MNETDALRILDERERLGMRMDLSTMEALLHHLGDFHENLPVVHVGGTNGKGSVAAMVHAALVAAGHKTGLYTSPHLVRFHERIRVGNQDIQGDALARAMARILPGVEAHPEATYFEVATVLALRHFVDTGVDVAVLEVGLGGRLDATNVFPRPLATVVTNVALEHTALLGNTEEAIAREKGGIIKPGVPLVTGASGPALDALRGIAAHAGAPVRVLGEDFVAIPGEESPAGQTLEVDGLRDYGVVRIPLPGPHQAENAALALATLDAVHAAGVDVPMAEAVAGLAQTRWPGRLQVIPGEPSFLLDGAHNPAAMEALADHLAQRKVRPVAVFGALADKDWPRMIEILAPHVADAVVTRVPSPRALEPSLAARAFSQAGCFGMVVEDPGHALATAANIAGPSGLVLVTGSLYLVGDALARL